ncbi:hypothetical protein [Candidatus Wolbachia massiliensis]|uniref:Uncharacterized protein n=1 Tax=Candidatus Wolbachia massiliensis TaxID=1845000 RepID=A0A7M3U304_9RICK|nr:hypothetical protein [Candidatus Wolbachia massiliensis]QOD38789.1 hypothetical protein ID128_03050 [Candidatus Wolbachia massiliensis]
MTIDQDLQNDIQNFASEGTEQKIGNIGPFTLKSGGKALTEQQLKAVVRGSHVQNIVDDMTKDVNETFISQLNTILIEERGKIAKLIQDVGDDESGLIKEINDIKSLLEPLPMDSPVFL